MPRSTRVVRLVAILAVAAVAVTAPYAEAAAKKKPKKPTGPVPGSIVKTIDGTYAHGFPRITQNVWSEQNCASTSLGGQETNNVSASIVPISAYAGKQLTVTFTPSGTLPAANSWNVAFFDSKCARIDVNDGKPDNGQWTAQQAQTKQAGLIPTGAAFLMLQTAVNSTQFEASTDAAKWEAVIRIPMPSDVKPTPLPLSGNIPV